MANLRKEARGRECQVRIYGVREVNKCRLSIFP